MEGLGEISYAHDQATDHLPITLNGQADSSWHTTGVPPANKPNYSNKVGYNYIDIFIPNEDINLFLSGNDDWVWTVDGWQQVSGGGAYEFDPALFNNYEGFKNCYLRFRFDVTYSETTGSTGYVQFLDDHGITQFGFTEIRKK